MDNSSFMGATKKQEADPAMQQSSCPNPYRNDTDEDNGKGYAARPLS
jgi:hypothetical protein